MSAFLDILQKYALTRKVNLNEDKISKDLAIVEKATKEVEIRKSHDYEQQISVEIIAEPESPDAHGHWYSKATIEKGFLSADTRWRKGELPMNLCHSYDDIKVNMFLLSSIILFLLIVRLMVRRLKKVRGAQK